MEMMSFSKSKNRTNHDVRNLTRIVRRLGVMVVLACLLAFQFGCFPWHRPGSRGFVGAAHTWKGSDQQNRVLKLINTDDESVVWEIEIPAGKWLITRFSDGGKRPQDTEDTNAELKYSLVDAGRGGLGNPSMFTSLKNSVTVPSANHRRWELSVVPSAWSDAGMSRDSHDPSDSESSSIVEMKPADESAPTNGNSNDEDAPSVPLQESASEE